MKEDKNIEELYEWPCQYLLGGGVTISATYIADTTDGLCKHPECNPINDDRDVFDMTIEEVRKELKANNIDTSRTMEYVQ